MSMSEPAGRIGLIGRYLLLSGMVALVAALPVSIALMNIGLTTAWIGALLCRAPVHRTVGFWWGIAYAGWQVISRAVGLAEGRDVGGGWGMAYTWTGLCLAQVAFTGSDPVVVRARSWAFRLLAIGTVLAAVVAFGQFFIGHKGSAKPLRIHPDGLRCFHATGFYAIHLTFGVIMMLVLITWSGGAFKTWVEGPRWRWLGTIGAGLGLILSMGRLAFVGIAVGAAAGIAARGRRYLLLATASAVALLVVAGAALAWAQPERFQAMARGEDGRWPIWRTSVALAQQHPLVGVGGSRQFRASYREQYDALNPTIPNEFPDGAPHAHNAILALAAEHGAPAVLLWLAFLAVILLALRARSDRHPLAWRTGAALVGAFLSAGMFEHLAGDGESCHALWTLLGCCLASSHDHDKS